MKRIPNPFEITSQKEYKKEYMKYFKLIRLRLLRKTQFLCSAQIETRTHNPCLLFHIWITFPC